MINFQPQILDSRTKKVTMFNTSSVQGVQELVNAVSLKILSKLSLYSLRTIRLQLLDP